MTSLVLWLSSFAAVGSGLIAGLLFAFSSFVMTALARLPAPAGIQAMQNINVAIVNPAFLTILVGTSAASLILAVLVARGAATPLVAIGAGLYLLGVIGVTAAFNIPRNDALAALDPTAATSVAAWNDYVQGWLFFNHLRTGAAIGATCAFVVALSRSSGR